MLPFEASSLERNWTSTHSGLPKCREPPCADVVVDWKTHESSLAPAWEKRDFRHPHALPPRRGPGAKPGSPCSFSIGRTHGGPGLPDGETEIRIQVGCFPDRRSSGRGTNPSFSTRRFPHGAFHSARASDSRKLPGTGPVSTTCPAGRPRNSCRERGFAPAEIFRKPTIMPLTKLVIS